MRILILVWSIAIAPLIQAQEITWGQSFEQREDVVDYLGEVGAAQYFGAVDVNDHYYVQIVGRDLSTSLSVKLADAVDQKRHDFERVVIMNGRIHHFYSFNRRSKKTRTLFAQELDPSTLKPLGPSKELSVIEYHKYNLQGEFEFAVSKNGKRLAILYDNPDNFNKPETFEIQVFDESMTLTWEQTVTLRTIHELFVLEDFDVSNQGRVYLCNTRYDRRPGFGKLGEVIMHPFVSILHGDSNEVTDVALDFPELLVNDLQLEISPEGTAFVVGTSSELSEKSTSALVFGRISASETNFVEVGLSEEVLFNCLSEPSEKLARQAFENRGKAPEVEGLGMNDIQIKSNGSIVVALETSRKTDGNVRGGDFAQGDSFEVISMRDIVIAELTSDGKLNYDCYVPKRQQSAGQHKHFASFEMALIEDDTYLFYNDHDSNLNLKRSYEMLRLKNQQRCKPTLACIDAKGNVKRSHIHLNTEGDYIIRPATTRKLAGKSEVILYARERSLCMMGKLKF